MSTRETTGRITKIGGIGAVKGKRRLVDVEPLPAPGREEVTLDLLPEGLKEIERRVGTRWARIVGELRDEGLVGSLPELMVYAWLRLHRIPFNFQSSALGGRTWLGGMVADFILLHLPDLMVWRVMGDYWHQRPGTVEDDKADKVRLLGANVDGRTVAVVVDIWESDIYDRTDMTLETALTGREVRSL